MKQVRPKKNLGQHFLTDLNIAKAIADTVDACPDLPILEVGPGMGVMTQYLVEKPRPFKVVEIDRESVAYLQERFPEFTRSEERGTRKEEGGTRIVLQAEIPQPTSLTSFLAPRSSFLEETILAPRSSKQTINIKTVTTS
jgi:hypothetical protein